MIDTKIITTGLMSLILLSACGDKPATPAPAPAPAAATPAPVATPDAAAPNTAAATASSPTEALGQQDFTLVNNTGYDIDQVYVSSATMKDWLNDILGKDILPEGQEVQIHFPNATANCNYDLKVVYTDKEEVTWDNIDLCKEEKLTLHWDKKSGDSSVTFD